MLLNKNKKTILHKNTRFDANRFKRQLSEARGYKRSGATYDSISRWRKVKIVTPIVVAIGLLVYLFFVPNVFFAKNIIVHGAPLSMEQEVRVIVDNWLSKKKLGLFINRNLLLLNAETLARHVVNAEQSVYQVTDVKKVWFKRTLELTIVPRQEMFFLQAGDKLFTVSLDGKVYREVDSGHLAPTGLLKIIGNPEQGTHVGQSIFTDSVLESLKVIKSEFHAETSFDVELIDLSLAEEYIVGNKKYTHSVGEFVVKVVQNEQKKTPAFFIFFDANSDISHVLVKLKALLDSFSQDRLRNLAYIDMRFKNRGFVCLRGTACTKPVSPPPPLLELTPPP